MNYNFFLFGRGLLQKDISSDTKPQISHLRDLGYVKSLSYTGQLKEE